jgi:hypothetical protein
VFDVEYIYVVRVCAVIYSDIIYFRFRELTETEMFFDIWISGFDTCKWFLLIFVHFVKNEMSFQILIIPCMLFGLLAPKDF